ncbi:MAG: VCBS repeat-containing protein, partial [Flavisolibacter sp.]
QDQYSKNCLQRNNGNGSSFSDIALLSGVSATDWSWSPLFADFDNDGNKDLFISSGIVKRPLDLDFVMFFSNTNNRQAYNNPDSYNELLEKMPDGFSHPFFFRGNGDLNFKDVSDDWGTGNMKGCYNGAAYADLDNDGKIDMVINSLNAPALILKNNAPQKNFLSISFRGNGMNKTGIGTKAYVFVGGKIQYQQLMLTRGFMSSSDPRLHFGLDSVHTVDSLLVIWPDQKYQVLKNIAVNKQLIIKQDDAVQQFNYLQYFLKRKNDFEDISSQINVNWKHQENDFNEFNNQYLIPHLESTKGPKMAVADVNKDGLDDIFICGAKGQPGCLLIQTPEGKFLRSDTAIFEKNKWCEGVDAVFFDANNDGFPDLYVVSGGDEYEDGNLNLSDHLYLNNGKGHFSELPNVIPEILKNKSCVAVSDVNKDGYVDIFVGGFTSAGKHGYTSQASYLLLNDGKGKFKLAGDSIFSLQEPGIVTSATFADINNDGWTDLIVAGEWMGIKSFINHHGKFHLAEINNSTGLWQTVYATDVNGDGLIDILAGNWGHNSKLYAGKDGPLKLYIKDFLRNGSVEQIMTYFINGQEYPFLGKDQLEHALPSLKKAHLTYNEVAGKNVNYMFGEMLKGYKELKAETLSSACFINDGKGNFKKTDLPEQLQLAPISAFTSFSDNGTMVYLAVGNFYGVLPYEGRYDALSPTIFSLHDIYKVLYDLPSITIEARDVKWIRYKNNEQVMVISANNSGLIFLKRN